MMPLMPAKPCRFAMYARTRSAVGFGPVWRKKRKPVK